MWGTAPPITTAADDLGARPSGGTGDSRLQQNTRQCKFHTCHTAATPESRFHELPRENRSTAHHHHAPAPPANITGMSDDYPIPHPCEQWTSRVQIRKSGGFATLAMHGLPWRLPIVFLTTGFPSLVFKHLIPHDAHPVDPHVYVSPQTRQHASYTAIFFCRAGRGG